MATVADLGIERHELRKFYENIAKMENLLKCPKCQKIVRTILTLHCSAITCTEFAAIASADQTVPFVMTKFRKEIFEKKIWTVSFLLIDNLNTLQIITRRKLKNEQNQRQKSAKSYVKFFVPNDVLKIHK